MKSWVFPRLQFSERTYLLLICTFRLVFGFHLKRVELSDLWVCRQSLRPWWSGRPGGGLGFGLVAGTPRKKGSAGAPVCWSSSDPGPLLICRGRLEGAMWKGTPVPPVAGSGVKAGRPGATHSRHPGTGSVRGPGRCAWQATELCVPPSYPTWGPPRLPRGTGVGEGGGVRAGAVARLGGEGPVLILALGPLLRGQGHASTPAFLPAGLSAARWDSCCFSFSACVSCGLRLGQAGSSCRSSRAWLPVPLKGEGAPSRVGLVRKEGDTHTPQESHSVLVLLAPFPGGGPGKRGPRAGGLGLLDKEGLPCSGPHLGRRPRGDHTWPLYPKSTALLHGTARAQPGPLPGCFAEVGWGAEFGQSGLAPSAPVGVAGPLGDPVCLGEAGRKRCGTGPRAPRRWGSRRSPFPLSPCRARGCSGGESESPRGPLLQACAREAARAHSEEEKHR